jgi:hypothetical protein
VAIDNRPRTVDITVDRVAEKADSPTITAAISQAGEDVVDIGLVGQAARVAVIDTGVSERGDAENHVGDDGDEDRRHSAASGLSGRAFGFLRHRQ